MILLNLHLMWENSLNVLRHVSPVLFFSLWGSPWQSSGSHVVHSLNPCNPNLKQIWVWALNTCEIPLICLFAPRKESKRIYEYLVPLIATKKKLALFSHTQVWYFASRFHDGQSNRSSWIYCSSDLGRSLMFTRSRCLRSTKDSGCGVKTFKFSIAKTALGVVKKKLGESNMTHMTQIEPD